MQFEVFRSILSVKNDRLLAIYSSLFIQIYQYEGAFYLSTAAQL